MTTLISPQLTNARKWKLVGIIIAAVLVVGVGGWCLLSSKTLVFHESWSPGEREQIERCYRVYSQPECPLEDKVVVVPWPGTGSGLDRFCTWVYRDLLSLPAGEALIWRREWEGRRVIEETAATGNAGVSTENDFSLLHVALILGENDLARSLVDRGADVNLRFVSWRGEAGDTPLSLAICGGIALSTPVSYSMRRSMVDYLLSHGADIKAPACIGMPVSLQGLMGIFSAKTSEEKREAEELLVYLLEKGAPVEWKNSDSQVVRLIKPAIELNMPFVVQYLLDQGEDPLSLPAKLQEKWKKMNPGAESDEAASEES